MTLAQHGPRRAAATTTADATRAALIVKRTPTATLIDAPNGAGTLVRIPVTGAALELIVSDIGPIICSVRDLDGHQLSEEIAQTVTEAIQWAAAHRTP